MIFRGVIFDLDGTLADTLDDLACAMNRVLVQNNFPTHIIAGYKSFVGKGLENLVMQSLPPENQQTEIISACLEEMIADYSENCLVKTNLYEGIVDLLAQLIDKKIKLAVFSNKADPLTQKIVKALLPDIPFVKIKGSKPGVPKKPDPYGALDIADEMALSVKHIIYLGDSDVDMETACSAGMYPAGAIWGFRTEKELITHGAKTVIKHPLELLKLFG
jgi:phosphoglycolate phosphatase